MRKGKTFLALLMAAALLLGMSSGVLADFTAEDYAAAAAFKTLADIPADLTGKTIILHSNDVHGALDGYAYIAGLRDELESRGAEVILADAGDYSQGTIYVSTVKGASAVDMMNAAGYDVVTLGNHEFDFGYAQLKDNMSKAESFAVVCADVLENGAPIFQPSCVYETKSGVAIAFIGVETPETQTKVNPGLIKGISFLAKTDIYDCVQAVIDSVAEADLIIGLTHLGVDDESAPDGHRSVDLFANTEGLDFLLDGHSHTVMTAGENGEPIQSTGTKFANIGVVVIDDAAKAIEDHFLMATEGMAKNEEVAALAQTFIDEIDAQYGEVFATTEVLLNGERDPGNRTEETNLGDLITDAMVWSVLKEDGALTVDDAHAVGITNGGGIRATIDAGDISMKDINTVLPFGNTVAVVYVTGAELLEALEASTYSTPGAIGGYPQTSGISFTIDTSKPYDANAETYPESTYYGPASIQRVNISAINGQPFDPEATYAVITNNFCAAGGDTYYAFQAASDQFDTGIPMDEAVMAYIEEELGGVVSAARYGQPDGEQRQISAPPAVSLTTQALTVNGEAKETEIYNIDGSNYFKLRDIAALLDGTPSQFGVSYDEAAGAIAVTTGTGYSPVGGELTMGEDKSDTCVESTQSLTVDGEGVSLGAYNLGGNNFFKLRDLGGALGFAVDYDEATRTIQITTG